MKKWLSTGMLVALLGLPTDSPAGEVHIPLRLNNEFLHHALVQQIYTGPDHTAPVWNDGSGCNYLVLFHPRIDPIGKQIRITSQGKARLGTALGQHCISLLDWKGTIEVLQKPILEPQSAIIYFQTIKSAIYDSEGHTSLAAEKLWDQVKNHVQPQLEIDLRPMIVELQNLLPLILPLQNSAWVQKAIDSLALTQVSTEDNGIEVTLRFMLPDFQQTKPAISSEPILSIEELQHWDAFLTFVIEHAATESRPGEFRRILLEILLDGRHDIEKVLTSASTTESDPVRALFLQTWQRLAPVLRQLSTKLSGQSALRYLSFIAASDMLELLDQLGPRIGLEITADGLRRLARTLAPQEGSDPLFYSFDVDPSLRQAFGFGPPLPAPRENLTFHLGNWLWRTAWAADEIDNALVTRLNQWVPTISELGAYLPLVRKLLDQTVEQLLYAHPLKPQFQPLYRWLILATAWQESCWRQFIRHGNRIKPLSSGSGSVGLMQVNQNVWRGFYDVKGLKQDIAYNASAGGEILMHYLVDYAIKKGEHTKTGKVHNLARATYAAYNGGPRHLSRYRKAATPKSLHKIDAAFWDKYQTVKQGNELAVAQCFGVSVSSLQTQPTSEIVANP